MGDVDVSSEAAALARPLLVEAVRRIVEQDAAAKLKKRRAKRKRLKKLAKKQGRNR